MPSDSAELWCRRTVGAKEVAELCTPEAPVVAGPKALGGRAEALRFCLSSLRDASSRLFKLAIWMHVSAALWPTAVCKHVVFCMI